MKKSYIFIIFLSSMFFLSNISYAQVSRNLFKIERSKNANIVMYDVFIDENGEINKRNPMDAYWMLYADKGQRQDLSTFDKKAYGYKVKYNEEGFYNLNLKAVEDNIELKMVDGDPKAELMINKKPAYLTKVYVSSEDGFLGIPKVSYYTLTGIDTETGEEVSEKIDIK